MPTDIVVPTFGESVVEATVGRWMKSEGDSVEAGEPVVELETEKVNVQVSSEETGVLARVLHKEGDTVHPGDVLGVIEAGLGMGVTATPPGISRVETRPERVLAEERAAIAAAGEPERARVSPVAQRLAEELNVDLTRVRGSGPGGRIMKEDVEAYARQREGERAAAPTIPPAAPVAAPSTPATLTRASAPPPEGAHPVAPSVQRGAAVPAPAPPGASPRGEGGRGEVRQRLSRRRATIARRLVEAQQTSAMLTTFNEIDMSAVLELRRRRREAFRASTGVDLGFMPFFVKAAVGALKAYPQLNSELQGDELVLKQYYDIGVAIGDPEGLVVPVLRDADRMSFAEIEKSIADFVQKAADRRLSLEELRGGTFTITNGGVYGSLLSTPILNPPQVGILGMHRIMERPVASDGQVVIRPMMYVALTYDHRVVDGRDSVLFLVRLKELVEDPERLLLEG